MPFACGLRRPVVVLPAGCDGWAPDRRRAVLLHELAHVRRRDLAGHTLARLVCAAYWFHPLVWTAARRLRAESERACDDLALACGARPADYAEHLLDIVSGARRGATPPAAALAMARRSEFEGRMLDILDPERPRRMPTRRQSAALVTALAAFAGVVGAAGPAPAGSAALGAGQPPPGAPRPAAPARPAAVARAPEVGPTPRIASTPNVSAARDAGPAPRVGRAPDEDAAPGDAPAPDAGPGPEAGGRAAARAAAAPREVVVEVAGPVVAEVIADGVGSAAASARANAGTPAEARAAELRARLGAAARGGAAAPDDERAALLARVLRTDTSAELRRVAAWGLAEHAAAAAAAPALAAALRSDRAAPVREMAAWALAEGRADAAPGRRSPTRSAATPTRRSARPPPGR
jgi:hypothetical protein